jgi:hypothetical protein
MFVQSEHNNLEQLPSRLDTDGEDVRHQCEIVSIFFSAPGHFTYA